MSEYNRNSSGGRNFEHRGLEGGTLSSYSRAGHSSTGHRSSSGTSRHTKSTAAHTSTGRRDTAMNRAAAGRSGHTSGRYKKKRRNRLDITQILLIVIGVLAVILIITERILTVILVITVVAVPVFGTIINVMQLIFFCLMPRMPRICIFVMNIINSICHCGANHQAADNCESDSRIFFHNRVHC